MRTRRAFHTYYATEYGARPALALDHRSSRWRIYQQPKLLYRLFATRGKATVCCKRVSGHIRAH